MKNLLLFLTICLGVFVIPNDSCAQGLRALRKAKEALKGVLEEKEPVTNSTDNPVTNPESSNESGSLNSSSKKTLNTRMTEGEVLATLDHANSAFNIRKYSSARYDIQQALVEIEIQMGHMVLDDMPKEVRNQLHDQEEDLVISTGAGFIGLEISRQYPSSAGNVTASIANNAMMFAPYNMALSNPTMTSQNENMKAVTVNGKRGILELDENDDSFKLVIPFGQASFFLLECEPCQNESEVKEAAARFDLDSYLRIMGETQMVVDTNK
ncbi:MAG: hypothetical protein ACFHWX_18435 [Bacteroidota bacterium]